MRLSRAAFAAMIASPSGVGVPPEPPDPIEVAAAGSANAATGVATTLDVTTTATIEVGDVLRVATANNGSQVSTAVSDGGLNTYSIAQSFNNGTQQFRVWYVRATTQIPSGTTITVTFGAITTGLKIITLQRIRGLVASPLDKTGTGATATSAVASITTSTLSQANEVVFADAFWEAGGALDAWTFDNGFAQINTDASGQRRLQTLYKIVSATTAQTPQVTNTASSARLWCINYDTWKGE